VREHYTDAEIARALDALGSATIAKVPEPQLEPSALGLDPLELRLLTLPPGAFTLAGLLCRAESAGIERAVVLRTVFIALSAGFWVAPTWER
jgi:hypothetical protein